MARRTGLPGGPLAGCFTLCIGLLAAAATLACETENVELNFQDGGYSYSYSARVAGTRDAVYGIITDHNRLGRINQHIVEARLLESASVNGLKRLLRVERCILSFCFDLIFVETIAQDKYTVTSTIVADGSTFLDGTTRWQLESLNSEHTRLRLTATQTPDFWIPPVIGPVILKRVLSHELDASCSAIEALIAQPFAQ